MSFDNICSAWGVGLGPTINLQKMNRASEVAEAARRNSTRGPTCKTTAHCKPPLVVDSIAQTRRDIERVEEEIAEEWAQIKRLARHRRFPFRTMSEDALYEIQLKYKAIAGRRQLLGRLQSLL